MDGAGRVEELSSDDDTSPPPSAATGPLLAAANEPAAGGVHVDLRGQRPAAGVPLAYAGAAVAGQAFLGGSEDEADGDDDLDADFHEQDVLLGGDPQPAGRGVFAVRILCEPLAPPALLGAARGVNSVETVDALGALGALDDARWPLFSSSF